MWPLEQMARDWLRGQQTGFLLHLGMHEWSLWRSEGHTYALVDRRLAGAVKPSQPHGLREAVDAMLSTANVNCSHCTLLLDSAWLPMCLLNVGAMPLATEAVRQLARLRFQSVWGDAWSDARVDVDYQPGTSLALAFALPCYLQDQLQIGRELQAWHQVQPTWVWAWNRAGQELNEAENGWLGLVEQDRTLLAHVSHGHVQAFHPAGARATSATEWMTVVNQAALGCGAQVVNQHLLLMSVGEQRDVSTLGDARAHDVCWIDLHMHEKSKP